MGRIRDAFEFKATVNRRQNHARLTKQTLQPGAALMRLPHQARIISTREFDRNNIKKPLPIYWHVASSK